MTAEWHMRSLGYSTLGVEGQPDYAGYVVRVSERPEGSWYAYGRDPETGRTFYAGSADTEGAAQELLDVLAGIDRPHLCEMFVSRSVGHCPEVATSVRYVWLASERRAARLALCGRHDHLMGNWSSLPVEEYRARFGLVRDAGISGARKRGELVAIVFERTEERRWTDGNGLPFRSTGDVVVVCREHGVVIRHLSSSFLDERHPYTHNNAALARENHLRDMHGITSD